MKDLFLSHTLSLARSLYSSNCIGPSGAAHLSTSLTVLTSLQTLDIRFLASLMSHSTFSPFCPLCLPPSLSLSRSLFLSLDSARAVPATAPRHSSRPQKALTWDLTPSQIVVFVPLRLRFRLTHVHSAAILRLLLQPESVSQASLGVCSSCSPYVAYGGSTVQGDAGNPHGKHALARLLRAFPQTTRV